MFKVGDILIAKFDYAYYGIVRRAHNNEFEIQWSNGDASVLHGYAFYSQYYKVATKLDKYLLGINDDTISDT